MRLNIAVSWLSAALLLALCLGAATACAATDRGADGAPSADIASANAAPAGRDARAPRSEALAAAAEEVERTYVIGPAAAREMGYRVAWQFRGAGERPGRLAAGHDSVFVLDARNFLTRIDREAGHRLWRTPAADPIEEVLGISYLPHVERVFLTLGGSMLVFDAVNGSQVDRQRLERVANTEPIRFGQFLIYGGRNGHLVWHSYEIAFQWRSYHVAPSIQIQPAREANVLIVVGTNGRVSAHDGATTAMLWDKRLLDRVVAPPAVGRGAVFVAGMDQHIWAWDLHNGRSLWRYLTESRLTDPPMLAGDHLYQQVPGEGLMCFEAVPLDAPGGNVLWTAAEIRGNVIAAPGDRLLVWDAEPKQMTIAEARSGAVIGQVNLPQVRRIISPSIDGRELLAVSDDGRVVRLVLRN